MKTTTPAAALAALLALGLSACSTTANPTTSAPSTAPTSASSTPSSSPAHSQKITPDGVAAVVVDYFGDRVDHFSSVGAGEQSTVAVSVAAAGSGKRDQFSVQVYDPNQADGQPGGDGCPPRPKADCRVGADGTAVATLLTKEGFTDGNVDGAVVTASALNPDTGRMVIAMYESWDTTPPVDADDLRRLVADERLAWLTDPAVNRAGKNIDLGRPSG